MSRQNMYLRKASMAPARFQMILSVQANWAAKCFKTSPTARGSAGSISKNARCSAPFAA
jgi:hypothetical protein